MRVYTVYLIHRHEIGFMPIFYLTRKNKQTVRIFFYFASKSLSLQLIFFSISLFLNNFEKRPALMLFPFGP